MNNLRVSCLVALRGQRRKSKEAGKTVIIMREGSGSCSSHSQITRRSVCSGPQLHLTFTGVKNMALLPASGSNGSCQPSACCLPACPVQPGEIPAAVWPRCSGRPSLGGHATPLCVLGHSSLLPSKAPSIAWEETNPQRSADVQMNVSAMQAQREISPLPIIHVVPRAAGQLPGSGGPS